jgi:predicted lipid carrier protein YhbT
MTTQALKHKPVLPYPLKLSARLIPAGLRGRALVASLNHLFKQAIVNGELDFMRDHVLAVRISDAGLDFRITLKNKSFVACEPWRKPDMTFEGTVYDFLLLTSRREDPDTLFFNRRLKLGGNTELGLQLKNFLDSLEMDEHWKTLQTLSEKMLGIAERFG